ncbi:MAG: MBL fold metallo-hydrolase [Anaerolineae bacterium]|jgi:glyoxylase-like metal-dependent hydrolase (beta-lactamase superfamily II)
MLTSLLEIIPGLYLVPGEGEGRFPFSHSFLIEGETWALLDTGAGIQRLQRLRETLGSSLDVVISSHSHPDHTAGNWLFDGLPLYAPVQAADSLGRLEVLSERFVEPGPLASAWMRFIRQHMGFRDAPPTHTFDDGHIFDFGGPQGGVKLIVLHTPGHTVDHVCFFEPTYGVLLSQDIDLTSFGPWYGHRESDIAQFKASMRRVMALEPRMIVSSHKGVIREDIQGHLARFMAVFDEREARIRRLLEIGYSVADMVDLSPIYGGHPYVPDIMCYWEEQMIRKHVERCLNDVTRLDSPVQSLESRTAS